MCDAKTFDILAHELSEARVSYWEEHNRLARMGDDHPQRDSQHSRVERAAARHDALVTAAQIVGVL